MSELCFAVRASQFFEQVAKPVEALVAAGRADRQTGQVTNSVQSNYICEPVIQSCVTCDVVCGQMCGGKLWACVRVK